MGQEWQIIILVFKDSCNMPTRNGIKPPAPNFLRGWAERIALRYSAYLRGVATLGGVAGGIRGNSGAPKVSRGINNIEWLVTREKFSPKWNFDPEDSQDFIFENRK